MRQLVTIQKIIDIQPIPDADAIEVATVLGWHCVVKKNEFKINDLCLYHEVDSLLPMTKDYEFLAKGGTKKTIANGREYEGYRLRTIKLRGQISQGLALPLSTLEGKKYPTDKRENPVYDFKEGTDVTELMGVLKYEQPVPANLSGEARGVLPSYIPKTDEMRIQSVPKILERYQGIDFYVTEKLDGSSTTMWFDKQGEFNVASRTMNWIESDSNSFWRAAKDLNVQEKMKFHPTIALQGELMGEGMQGNRLMISGRGVSFYNAYDFEKGVYLDYMDFCRLLEEVDLPMVPVVEEMYKLPKTVDELVAFATRKSKINLNCEAEGLVFRPLKEMKDEDLGRLSFKCINPVYLLKHGE